MYVCRIDLVSFSAEKLYEKNVHFAIRASINADDGNLLNTLATHAQTKPFRKNFFDRQLKAVEAEARLKERSRRLHLRRMKMTPPLPEVSPFIRILCVFKIGCLTSRERFRQSVWRVEHRWIIAKKT